MRMHSTHTAGADIICGKAVRFLEADGFRILFRDCAQPLLKGIAAAHVEIALDFVGRLVGDYLRNQYARLPEAG